jgi:hypothetical protein
MFGKVINYYNNFEVISAQYRRFHNEVDIDIFIVRYPDFESK